MHIIHNVYYIHNKRDIDKRIDCCLFMIDFPRRIITDVESYSKFHYDLIGIRYFVDQKWRVQPSGQLYEING